jgi:hypothetical protein
VSAEESNAMMRLRRASVIAALFLLAWAATSHAESAWILWSRIADLTKDDQWLDWTSGGSAFPTYDKCREKIREYTHVPEENSLADWFDWARGTGRYNKNGGVYITESGVLLVSPQNPRIASEWRCLPDTMDPRGPKASRR